MSIRTSASNMDLLQPVIISLVAFALGYQTRSYFTTPSLARGGSSSGDKTKRVASPATKSKTTEPPASPSSSIPDGATDPDSDSEDDAAARTSDLASVGASALEEVKLVLVVNDSLKMSKGKIAAQAGHATLAACDTLREANPRLYRKWQRQGQPKIALRGSTTEELEELAGQARRLNLCARMIQDAGRTQVAPGSKTVLGIGPGPARLINTVTGKLKLL